MKKIISFQVVDIPGKPRSIYVLMDSGEFLEHTKDGSGDLITNILHKPIDAEQVGKKTYLIHKEMGEHAPKRLPRNSFDKRYGLFNTQSIIDEINNCYSEAFVNDETIKEEFSYEWNRAEECWIKTEVNEGDYKISAN